MQNLLKQKYFPILMRKRQSNPNKTQPKKEKFATLIWPGRPVWNNNDNNNNKVAKTQHPTAEALIVPVPLNHVKSRFPDTTEAHIFMSLFSYNWFK